MKPDRWFVRRVPADLGLRHMVNSTQSWVSFLGISVPCGRICRRFPMRCAILIMSTLAALSVSLFSGCGSEVAPSDRSEPSSQPPFVSTSAHGLTREGEILVVEGGIDNVTQVGPGQFALSDENIQTILAEVYAEVPDIFDTIFVFTSFTDQDRPGIAQTININNVVEGLGPGLEVRNDREMFGLPRTGGRLASLSLMNSLLMWGNGSLQGLDAPDSFFRGVMAEELSRRWLFHPQFIDPDTGVPSNDLLGRGENNWSRLAQADGSYLDGNQWVDNGDGTFTNMGSNLGFAPLDLYLMGLRSLDEVEDIFVIDDATNMNGDPLDSASLIPEGAVINGTRRQVPISSIIQAIGPRVPPPLTRTPYDRAIVVLVTAPGQVRADWEGDLQVLQNLVTGFPQSWAAVTGGAVCLRSTDRCPEPVLGLSSFEFSDDNDNLIGPSDRSELTLTVLNGGLGTAENVQVELRPVGTAVQVDTSVISAPPIPTGSRTMLTTPFQLTVSSTVGCGDRLLFDVLFNTAEGPVFSDRFEVAVGSREVAFDPLNEDVDWTVNPDEDDTAFEGQWALGVPEAVVDRRGDLTQPEADRSTGEGELAFMTGPQASEDGSILFTSNDLDGGRTTLESPIFAIGETLDPSLVFFVWRVARNYVVADPVDLTDSDLVVQVSNDGGERYVELGRFSENTKDWTRLSFRIRDALEPTNRMRFRFVAEEEEPAMPADLLVEMGIDDLQIIDSLPECAMGPSPSTDAGVTDASSGPAPADGDDGGCGCSAAPTSDAWPALFVFALVMVWAVRRRDG